MSRAAAALAVLTLRNLGAGRRGWAALLLLALGPVLAASLYTSYKDIYLTA